MGKAMAVQTAKSSKLGLGVAAFRTFCGKAHTGKARIHTSRPSEARAVEDTLFGREKGLFDQL